MRLARSAVVVLALGLSLVSFPAAPVQPPGVPRFATLETRAALQQTAEIHEVWGALMNDHFGGRVPTLRDPYMP
jgi:hypothetical protein